MNGIDAGFLPVTKEEMKQLGWEQLDFLCLSGDAYVDHPSFGHAIITRVLVAAGYRVGIIAQPKWHDAEDIKRLGRPRLGVLVAAGNMDSMVNHYTAAKKPRHDDMYSPGGKAGFRPDRATIVYCNRVREAFGDIPVIIGGIEASLRRFAHYDYWSDKVRRSILVDSRADLLIYGMGEKPVEEIADALDKGTPIKDITNVRGTCYLTKDAPQSSDNVRYVPSFEEVRDDKRKYAEAVKTESEEQDAIRGKTLVQKHIDRYLVQNPPPMPLTQSEMDRVYSLPYARNYHPMYEDQGGIPAISEVKFSLTSVRGCFGACNFCALAFHQGRTIQARSHKSIIAEAQKFIHDPDFKGYIHDVGGPTANFRQTACEKQKKAGVCKDRQCLFPEPCPALKADHSDYVELLRKLRALDGVKKVFVRSGIRFDYLMADDSDSFFYELCEHHISGQLKVAPEHISPNALKYMGKPARKVYDKFVDKFYRINEKLGKKQYLVPYLMSSHPGSTLNDAIALALYLKEHHITPQQVQDFYPTPGTISTCMFYTGIDPRTMQPVYVPKSAEDKAMQRALLQYKNPDNYNTVYKALQKAGREDLIGFGSECLIRPKRQMNDKGGYKNESKNSGRKNGFDKNKRGVKARGGKAKSRKRH
ncbi:MAG: YgiQ family radical SAM protein [Clostridia bacterium]|nr:YgiQ family radical SAM protein [Clostridia bacterium]